jgi:hypothetical protein
MVLFPIAFIWLLCVMIWIIRNSLNEPDAQERPPRRWRPRPPLRPGRRSPHGSPSRGRAGAARARD